MHIAVQLIARFLAEERIDRSELQLVGLGALRVAVQCRERLLPANCPLVDMADGRAGGQAHPKAGKEGGKAAVQNAQHQARQPAALAQGVATLQIERRRRPGHAQDGRLRGRAQLARPPFDPPATLQGDGQ